MRASVTGFILSVCFASGSSCALAAESPPAVISDFIQEHCVQCHDATEHSGGLDLQSLSWSLVSDEAREHWISIYDRVQNGEMPPDSPIDPERSEPFADAIHSAIVDEIETRQQGEGRTVIRRLNRREFENSLRDLLGVELDVKHLLPEDGRSQGFDTVADGLRISAVQIEKLLEVVDVALDAAVRLTERPKDFDKRLRFQDEKEVRENLDTPEDHVDPVSGQRHRRLFRELDDAIVFISHGYSPDHLKQFSPPADGWYLVRISAYSVDARSDPISMRVHANDWKSDRLLGYFDLPPNRKRLIELNVRLSQKEHLRVSGHGIGIDDGGKSVWNVDSVKDWKVPGMAIEWIEIKGPLIEQWPPANMANLFGEGALHKLENRGRWTEQGHIAYELAPEDPRATASQAVARFTSQAFRRPLQSGEADRFIQLAHRELDLGRSYEQAMRVAMRAILVSPRFLIFDETPGKFDDFALASRLSYFLWSSPPDKALLDLAEEGRLSDPMVLGEQVERLLASPRSQQFVTSFVGQWLDVAQIDATSPDATLYPEYDDILRDSMVAETERFTAEMLTHDLPITNLIDSDFVMLDLRLADHYDLLPSFNGSTVGAAEVLFGEQFRRVSLPPDSPRGGVMTQAAVLKVTANGTVTSPVQRGSWILRRIIGRPPAPPPPVNAIEPDTRGATTIREQLAKHRDVESCNRCHREIDPPGFALECFDVIGGFRERYRSIGTGDQPTEKLHGRDIWEYKLGLPVDCSGQTADGTPFTGIQDYKNWMLGEHERILLSLTGKLVTYATGAGVGFADRDDMERIAERTQAQGGGLRTLVHEVVASDIFQSK